MMMDKHVGDEDGVRHQKGDGRGWGGVKGR